MERRIFEACAQLQSSEITQYVADKEIYKKVLLETMDLKRHNEIFKSEDWFEKLMDYVVKESNTQDNYQKNILNKVMMNEYEKLNTEVSNIAKKVIRFVSFTTKFDNIPMWHHYTNAHNGICLEYSTKDILDIYQINSLFPIFYVKTNCQI